MVTNAFAFHSHHYVDTVARSQTCGLQLSSTMLQPLSYHGRYKLGTTTAIWYSIFGAIQDVTVTPCSLHGNRVAKYFCTIQRPIHLAACTIKFPDEYQTTLIEFYSYNCNGAHAEKLMGLTNDFHSTYFLVQSKAYCLECLVLQWSSRKTAENMTFSMRHHVCVVLSGAQW